MSNVVTGIADDGVWIDDPEAPFRLKVSIDVVDGLPWLASLAMHRKPGYRHVAYGHWLAGIPLHEVVRVAAATVMGDRAYNESLYRQIAAGRPYRRRILTIAEWAVQVAWPGGPVAAIKEMWGVSRSTAYRWLRSARREAASTVRASGEHAREGRPHPASSPAAPQA